MFEVCIVGFGIYVIFDFGGQLCFGFDVNYVDNFDYCVDEFFCFVFVQVILCYFFGIDYWCLVVGYVGIWFKFGGLGEFVVDFII